VFVELRERELAYTVDRHEQIELPLFGPHLRQIDVDIAERIRSKLSSWRRPI